MVRRGLRLLALLATAAACRPLDEARLIAAELPASIEWVALLPERNAEAGRFGTGLVRRESGRFTVSHELEDGTRFVLAAYTGATLSPLSPRANAR